MRIIIAAPLLLVAGCSVQNDPRNGQTTIGFDQNVITNTTDRLGNVAEDAAGELERAGQQLRNDARGIDVDIGIRRQPPGNRTANSH